MPDASVIIPTYNHRDYVLRSLDSVFSQTYADYEVIVINDGSPDDTAKVLRPLAEAGRIRYFEQPNAGQAAARNRGLSECKGEFVAFLDDDDLWPADKLQWQVAFLRNSPHIGAVAGRAEFISEAGVGLYLSQFVPELTFNRLFEGNPVMSPGQVLIRRSCLADVGGLDVDIWGADDWDLWFKIAKRTRFVMEDRVALQYRLHSSNASKQSRRLYEASRMVLERHLQAVDATCRRASLGASYNFLYRYWGENLTADLKRLIKEGDVSGAFGAALLLKGFWRGVLADPSLFSRMSRDLMPHRLRAIWRGLVC